MRSVRSPRFGSLEQGKRDYGIDHGIALMRAKNGMRIALMQDTRTNLVGVDVRYLVGAAEDPPGRTGMAHLVEHLLFTARAEPGGPTISDELSDTALSHNAWTNSDETHYTAMGFEDQLAKLVSIEARRMQVTCDQIDAATFERERDVVLAEDTWRHTSHETLHDELIATLWGRKHPYGHRVSSKEIAQATREEACAFIASHYAPDRSILVITGNFRTEAAMKAVTAAFGKLMRRSTAGRTPVEPAVLIGETSTHSADIDEATAFIFFNAPSWGTSQWMQHELLSAMLRTELYTLDEREEWITDAGVMQFGGVRAPLLTAVVSVSEPARLNEAVEKVFAAAATLVNESKEVSEPARARLRTRLVSTYDAFMGAGSWIADFPQYSSHDGFFVEELAALDRTTLVEVAMYANATLDRTHSHVALVRPSGKQALTTRAEVPTRRREHDLQPWRTPVDPSEASRPLDTRVSRVANKVEEMMLRNGMRVLLAHDPHSPLVDARVVFPYGSAAEPVDRRGLAKLTAHLLANDTARLYRRVDAERIDFARELGTQLDTGVGERATVFTARGVATFADWHLWRLFWLLDAGIFPDDVVAAFHKSLRESHGKEEEDADARGDEALRARLFGAGHPYAQRAPGTAELLSISIPELEAFRESYYRANGATLIVSGGFDVAVMKRTIEELFGSWDGEAPPPPVTVPPGAPEKGPGWVAVLDEDATQVSVKIGFSTTSDPIRDVAARQVLRAILEDRVRVVREGLGATYNVSVDYIGGIGGGALLVTSDLERDRSGKALVALVNELVAVQTRASTLTEDFVRARRRALGRALADSAGATVLANELEATVSMSLPLSFFDAQVSEITVTTPDVVAAVAAADLARERMVVVIHGPRDAVKATLEAADQRLELVQQLVVGR
ncbi:pitrilysin family protein [Archangium sp. Cb G35]|uniref:M16 family metallopeptidase n=1 Tax=Archangium sp. Cb G35 TaxID=1920190 RepID=UPI0013010BC0|nr:M16 family metallopeptidase [Archangium sp. Cb G35]